MTTDVEQTAAAPRNTKETCLWRAKLAQEAKRYEDMAENMRLVAESGSPMTKDEDNMLAAAYKNVVDVKRSAKRTLMSVEELRQSRDDDPETDAAVVVEDEDDDDVCRWKTDEVKRYCDRVDREVRAVCADVLAVVGGRLSSAEVSQDPASTVFYWKLRADYNRYAAEATDDPQDHAASVTASRYAYEQGDRLGRQALRPIDPVRLGLMLNYSVFLYQVCGERQQGHDVAKAAFDEAVAEIDAIDDRTYDEATLIMRLIRDNLTIWSEEDGSKSCAAAADDSAAVTPPEENRATPPLPVSDESVWFDQP